MINIEDLPEIVSEILYRNDPIGTCCGSYDGGEDEYWIPANEIVMDLGTAEAAVVTIVTTVLLDYYELKSLPNEIAVVNVANEITNAVAKLSK